MCRIQDDPFGGLSAGDLAFAMVPFGQSHASTGRRRAPVAYTGSRIASFCPESRPIGYGVGLDNTGVARILVPGSRERGLAFGDSPAEENDQPSTMEPLKA